MRAYYNEFDAKTAAWLRELIKAGLIADGDVDERSIVDVRPADLAGYTQCHFFTGIGGWSYALRLAGWDDARPVWTGSCPCQPWSSAGKALGANDPRDLWPAWFELVRQCRPAVVFGEQVASQDGLAWLDRLYVDLEAADYAVGSSDLPAASVGAPHNRPRLWFVADTARERHERERVSVQLEQSRQHQPETVRRGEVGRMADGDEHGWGSSRRSPLGGESDTSGCGEDGRLAYREGVGRRSGRGREALQGRAEPGWSPEQSERRRDAGGLGNGNGNGCTRSIAAQIGADGNEGRRPSLHASGEPDWQNADWLPCRDGVVRPVESGTFPLAPGLPAGMGRLSARQRRLAAVAGLDGASLARAKGSRVIRLRGYGNAINPYVASEFIQAYVECEGRE